MNLINHFFYQKGVYYFNLTQFSVNLCLFIKKVLIAVII